MQEYRSHLLPLTLPEPFGRIALNVLDFGRVDAKRVVVCVHGLTRNAHDFDWIAKSLTAEGARVFSLDMPGRGDSPWLSEPMQYGYPLYIAACLAFFDNFHLRGVEWIGTSMGGLIGMMIAASSPNRISKLVMNDIGARISAEGIARIMQYVSTLPSQFDNYAAASAYLRTAFLPFGIEDEAVWASFIASSLKPSADGASVMLKTDPAIAQPLLAASDAGAGAPVDLSSVWENVSCPTLLIRGENSDLLAPETVSAMMAVHLKAEAVTIKGCGHAPSLTTPEQIRIISDFLIRDAGLASRAIGI